MPYPLTALRSRNYRLYFGGQGLSLVGTWMQKTVIGWLVYSLTHSPAMLGVAVFASLCPSFLCSFIGGIVADKYNRRNILLCTQLLALLQAVALAAVTWKGECNVWVLIELGALLGIINAFDVPARQSLIADMAGTKELPRVLALNASMVHLARLAGAALAGFVIERQSAPACFSLNALSYLVVVLSLGLMRLPDTKLAGKEKSTGGAFLNGFAYVRNTPTIAHNLSLLFLLSLCVLPFTALLPAYTKDVFKGSAATLGYIEGAMAVGALSGAVFLATIKPGSAMGRPLLLNIFLFSSCLIAFSHTSGLLPASVSIAVCGFSMLSVTTIINTHIQATVCQQMRGRVAGFYAMCFFGVLPVGTLAAGGLSELLGLQPTVFIEGMAGLAIGIWHMASRDRRKAENPVSRVHKNRGISFC